MTKSPDQPLRGEAAWKASKAELAQRNNAARARGGKLRAASEAVKAGRNVGHFRRVNSGPLVGGAVEPEAVGRRRSSPGGRGRRGVSFRPAGGLGRGL